MKIGILTQPLEANYGGIIQNYALQQVLLELGHEPITLRTGRFSYWGYLVTCLKSALSKIIHFDIKNWDNVFPYFAPKLNKRKVGLEAFIKKNILVTPKLSWYSPKLINKYSLQALCVGSDKIWAPYFKKRITDVFFAFAKDYDIIKFSYAPSFGTNQWTFSKSTTLMLQELVKKFSGLSVREESGKYLCSENLKQDAFWAIDPTLLLGPSDYNSVCESKPCNNNPFLFAYILDLSDEKIKLVNDVASKFELDLLVKSAEKNISSADTMESWLSCFRDAKVVITDSFHGAAFSINYNKDFYCLVNKSRGLDRFATLISLTGLHERFLDSTIDAESLDNTPINWTPINSNIQSWRKESINYIKRCLE